MEVSDFTDYLPEIGLSGSFIVDFIMWMVFALILGGMIGFVVYYFMIMKKYNLKIEVFQKVSGRYERVAMDKAMIIKLGRGGDQIFLLKKHKKYITKGRLQIARNTYWYLIREDGEWINISIEDFDKKMRELKVNYLHEEMRYTRAALQKFLKDNYDKTSFLQKYGGLLAYSLLIIITGIFVFLIMGKGMDLMQTMNSVMETTKDVIETQKNILASLDNICSTSGLKPA